MKDVILVLGYNNTRINDVRKIREKAKQIVNAATILCKKDPNETDKSAVDAVIDVGLEQSDANVKTILDACEQMGVKVVGVLPFSDQGTQLGARLARHLNLPGAHPEKIGAALNKQEFRDKEKTVATPAGYVPVSSKRITSLDELQAAFNEYHAVFLKPIAEGNSRGCIAIKKFEECAPAWEQVKKYLAGGITAERLVENAQEYSWDHVAGYYWVTEKMTTQNQYRAEPQHILPAPVAANEQALLVNGAKFMADVCGHNGSACHNEIFLLNTKDRVMAVEPNLRPAGGKLWDLSSHAFENFDPWNSWILWATGKIDNSPKVLKQKAFAGMRNVIARKNGKLKAINTDTLDKLSQQISGDFIELVWLKKPGDMVTSSPNDNADFVGYVTAKATEYSHLAALLNRAEELLATTCEIEN